MTEAKGISQAKDFRREPATELITDSPNATHAYESVKARRSNEASGQSERHATVENIRKCIRVHR